MTPTNANPVIGDDGARQDKFCKDQSALNSQVAQRAQPLCAQLSGATCTAAGVAGRGTTPVLALCRQLLAAGLDPDRALEVYRSGRVALRVRSIGAGAQLTVKDDSRGTPRFVRYRPGPAARASLACGEALPVRQKRRALP